MEQGVVPTIRTLGYRGGFPPIIHAKLALLGHLWWTDDGEFGEEVIGFEARRPWVSSANFTSSSRRNLEFGYWAAGGLYFVSDWDQYRIELIERA